jgi:hypothetical protein
MSMPAQRPFGEALKALLSLLVGFLVLWPIILYARHFLFR